MEDRGITYNWPNIWRYLSVQVDSESPYQLLQDPDTQMFAWTVYQTFCQQQKRFNQLYTES